MSEALDRALAAINRAVTESDDEGKHFIAAKVRGLIRGYDAKWFGSEWESLAEEEEFHLPLVNPETGRESRTFTWAGKFDGRCRYVESGKNYLRENKTCSEDIEDPNSPYWRRMTVDSQVSAYQLANWQLSRKLDGTLYDVVRKPLIRPKHITGADQKVMIQQGTYCGQPIEKRLRLLKDETLELYEIRLTQDVIENHGKYFQRRSVPRLDSEVMEFAAELWEIGQSILETRNNNRHFRNADACMTYGSVCPFLDLCSGHSTLDSDKWAKRESVHAELDCLNVDDRGVSVLSNSRVRCFQSCRRKHFYQYELGIERVNEEEREALVFGSLWHLAIEHWWSYFRKGSDNDCIDSAASEVAQSAAEA